MTEWRHWMLGWLLGGMSLVALAQPAAKPPVVVSMAELTQKLQPQPGFLDVWRDAERARVLLAVRQLDEPFLLLTSLPSGLGSNDVGLDRGQPGVPKMVHFEKRGARLFLVQENMRYMANSSNAQERASVADAFAPAVIWSGEILASEGGAHLVDFSSFLLSDRHGVAKRLAGTKQGTYRVDDKRSAVLTERSKSFPDNTELEALLTFEGPGEGAFLRDVVADATSPSLRQHVSFVRLPPPGFQPRVFHPGSGGNDESYVDFATPLAQSLTVSWQIRHRLEKTDPSAARSPVKKPIVYYLDTGAPEPVRSALLEGARWWVTAFEKAGFKDAFRVEMLPDGADPMDVRYNVIHWVHRSTRGWSYGNAMTDPRTGEIIKGTVMLGSQRVRQDILIAESLLAAYGKGGNAKQKQALDMALARLRQLSAHEVGHTLGFAHNFAASRQGNGSVMDYPHPIVKLDAQGEVDLQDAYGVGVGPWDDFLVAHAYAQFAPNEESAALAALRAQAKARGLQYVGEADSRSASSQHSDGVLWDFGPDSFKTWDQLMAVRKRALQTFSVDVLPELRQTGELEARLVPVYLLHRYQAESLAHLLGGGDFEYGLAGDVRNGAVKAGVRTVDAATQRRALTRLLQALHAEQLALPAAVLDALSPPSEGYQRDQEYFANRMGTQFDALAAVEAASVHIAGVVLNAERLNRVAWQQARDPQQLGVGELLKQVFQHTWQRESALRDVVAAGAVQSAANGVTLNILLHLLDGGKLHRDTEAQVRQSLGEWAQWLAKHPVAGATGVGRQHAAELIRRYLANPTQVKLRPLPAVPPGAPI